MEIQIVPLSVGQATSHSDYSNMRWPPGKHHFDITHSDGGTLRIDMSGRVNTWPAMDIEVDEEDKYKFTSHDGNSLHAEVRIKPGQKVSVLWGLTQGDFPEFYSYRFALDS